MNVGWMKRTAAKAAGFNKAESYKVKIEQTGDEKMTTTTTNPIGTKAPVEVVLDGKSEIEMDSPEGTKMRATCHWEGTALVTKARNVDDSTKGIDIFRTLEDDGTMRVVLSVVGGKSAAKCTRVFKKQ